MASLAVAGRFVGDDGAGPGNLSFVGCRLLELARWLGAGDEPTHRFPH